MLDFVGYNFLFDGDCLTPVPTNVDNITRTRLENGIFDYYLASNNIDNDSSEQPNKKWEFGDIIHADFNGNLNGGNVDLTLSQITSLRLKRRVKGTFEWTTLAIFKIKNEEDLKIVFNDYLNRNFELYEYALVPVLNNNEGDYYSSEIESSFDGVFISDGKTIKKFYEDVEYGVSEKINKTTIFEPFGKRYPVVVSNSKISYERGSVSGKILPLDYEDNRKIDRFEIVKRKNEIVEFLCNKKPKILKDWNGNIWLVSVIGDVNTNYDSLFGMGIVTVNFNYAEIGDSTNTDDLIRTGFVIPEDNV